MRKLFLDSANLDEIKQIAGINAISGVTTNPSLISKEQKSDFYDHLKRIAELLSTTKKHLSVEVITLEPQEMIQQSHYLNRILKQIAPHIDLAIKIPVLLNTLEVIQELEKSGIVVNATACMKAEQVDMAIKSDASYISFFYNRMKDAGIDANLEINKTIQLRVDESKVVHLPTPSFKPYDYHKIICGSIRKPQDILDCWANGANIVTASLKIIKELVEHPKTVESVNGFQKDIETWLK